jgi:hypothetical protein
MRNPFMKDTFIRRISQHGRHFTAVTPDLCDTLNSYETLRVIGVGPMLGSKVF